MSFDNGRAAFEAGSFVEAAEAFEDAYAAWPIPELLFNAAASYQALARSEEAPFGAYAMAVARYRQFLGVRPKDMSAVEAIVAGLEGDIARVAGGEQAAARSSIPALRGAVIVQSVPGGATLYLDDRSSGPLGTTPWSGPIEGAHRIIVEKAGYKAFETDIAPLPGALVVVSGRLGTS
jgi:tetratricopeptide (TPR) repeat protein